MIGGSITISSEIKEHWIWDVRKPERLLWWLDLLLSVNTKPGKVVIGMQILDCGRGQTIKSLGTWAAQWGVSKDTVRHFFNLLEKGDMITRETLKIVHDTTHDLHTNSTRSYTRITICKYESWVASVHDTTHEQHTIAVQEAVSNTILTNKSNNIVKDIVKDSYSKVDFSFVEDAFKPCFFQWLEHKKKRSGWIYPFQELTQVYDELKANSGNDPQKAAEFVQHSINSNWANIHYSSSRKNQNTTTGVYTQEPTEQDTRSFAPIE